MTISAEDADGDEVSEEDLEAIFNGSNDFTDVTDQAVTGNDEVNTEFIHNARGNEGQYVLYDGAIHLTGAEGTTTLDFSDIDASEYDFEAEVFDATGTDSDSVTVNDVGDGELSLENSVVEEQQGDYANVTVQFDGDASTGELVIGDESDVGYQANVSIDSNGEEEVSILFNTYAAGSTGNGTIVQFANPDDTDAELGSFDATAGGDQNIISDILATGDYTLSVSTDNGNPAETLEDPDTLDTLVINERSTTNQQIWTASDSTVSDITDADEPLDELTTQIEGDNVTQADTIAEGDQVIHQIEASGLTGLLDSEDEDPTAALAGAVDNGMGSMSALAVTTR